MRVFVAGATGVIGRRVVELLVRRGDTVGAMTRNPANVEWIEAAGAEAIVCDVYDAPDVAAAVAAFEPDVILNELTDLPDDVSLIAGTAALNARIRTEGNGNLLAAARAAGVKRFVAQSVAFTLSSEVGAAAVAELERSVLDYGGVVLRYGEYYGPGTYHEGDAPEGGVQIDRAAQRTVEHLGDASGVVTIQD